MVILCYLNCNVEGVFNVGNRICLWICIDDFRYCLDDGFFYVDDLI